MKIRLLFLLAGVLLVMGSATGSVVEVGHWNFDEGAGNEIGDSSPEGNDGTISNSSMWTTPGYDGTGFSLSFGGYSNPVEANVPHDTSLDFNGYIALSAWVKPDYTGHSENTLFPVIVKGGTGSSVSYALHLYKTRMTFQANYQTGGTEIWVQSDVIVPDANWSHIKAVYDMENVSFYIEDEETSIWQLVYQEATNYEIINNNSPLAFGIDSPGFTERYGGLIDEVVVEVPEPNTILLLSLGALALQRKRRV